MIQINPCVRVCSTTVTHAPHTGLLDLRTGGSVLIAPGSKNSRNRQRTEEEWQLRAWSYGACFESRSSSSPIPDGFGAPEEGYGPCLGISSQAAAMAVAGRVRDFVGGRREVGTDEWAGGSGNPRRLIGLAYGEEDHSIYT